MNSKFHLNNTQFPCKMCRLNVNKNAKAIQCDLSKCWVHIECTQLDYIDYKYFQSSNDPQFCATCCSAIFLFASLNSNCFFTAISCDRFNKKNKNKKQVETKETTLLLNPSSNLTLFFNQLNNTEKNNDPGNFVNSKYYSVNEIQSL